MFPILPPTSITFYSAFFQSLSEAAPQLSLDVSVDAGLLCGNTALPGKLRCAGRERFEASTASSVRK